MKAKKILPLFLIFFYTVTNAQILSTEEQELYDLIMEYRQEKGLPSIPLSESLMTVAQLHVNDLVENKPDTGDCNPHSWSSNDKWSSCCYSSERPQGKCMWDKPRELTSYTGNGYEIACGSNVCCSDFVMTASFALNSWKKSKAHNAVIINADIWNKNPWNAIGIGLHKGFAVVWFGKEAE